MILPFKTKFPWGEPTRFVDKIIKSVVPDNSEEIAKLHTIRESLRIQPGQLLHMATGNRTKQYYQFNKNYPGLLTCVSTQGIVIYHEEREVLISKEGGRAPGDKFWNFRELPGKELQQFIRNDGFDKEEDFWRFFDHDFTGQIIHWTTLRY